jgi:hypothetical protein
VEAGICKTGVLDNAHSYGTKDPVSASQVPVNVIKNSLSGNLGMKVKPGENLIKK